MTAGEQVALGLHENESRDTHQLYKRFRLNSPQLAGTQCSLLNVDIDYCIDNQVFLFGITLDMT